MRAVHRPPVRLGGEWQASKRSRPIANLILGQPCKHVTCLSYGGDAGSRRSASHVLSWPGLWRGRSRRVMAAAAVTPVPSTAALLAVAVAAVLGVAAAGRMQTVHGSSRRNPAAAALYSMGISNMGFQTPKTLQKGSCIHPPPPPPFAGRPGLCRQLTTASKSSARKLAASTLWESAIGASRPPTPFQKVAELAPPPPPPREGARGCPSLLSSSGETDLLANDIIRSWQ